MPEVVELFTIKDSARTFWWDHLNAPWWCVRSVTNFKLHKTSPLWVLHCHKRQPSHSFATSNMSCISALFLLFKRFIAFCLQGQMYDSQGRRPPGMGGGGYSDNSQYGQYPPNNQRYPMQGYPQQVCTELSFLCSFFSPTFRWCCFAERRLKLSQFCSKERYALDTWIRWQLTAVVCFLDQCII